MRILRADVEGEAEWERESIYRESVEAPTETQLATSSCSGIELREKSLLADVQNNQVIKGVHSNSTVKQTVIKIRPLKEHKGLNKILN